MHGSQMGGIAGICRPGGFGHNPIAVVQPAETLRRMLDAMAGDGAEGEAVWLSPAGCALGQVQLTETPGAQPIANEDGTLWLVAQGEIGNAAAVRAELANRHQFQTGSDLELILHLVEEVGPEGLDLLQGNFACALWGPGRELILARDPLGLMPLYYGADGEGNLLFASKVEALAPEVDWVEAVQPGARWTGALARRQAHVI
jgi:asparagine synthase (glutamine-hydrolysing)